MNSILNPYLFFDNKAREALAFYQTVFGGEVSINTFGDMNVPNMPADGVMHGALSVDGKPFLMASDAAEGKTHDGFSMSVTGEDAEELRAVFAKLSEGATITQPLAVQMWGDEFGQLVDKYGVMWMVNINTASVGKPTNVA